MLTFKQFSNEQNQNMSEGKKQLHALGIAAVLGTTAAPELRSQGIITLHSCQ